ncbi:MAG: uroporphyrinogen-III synthase [Gammaproteobacteria bacterium]
MTKIDQPALLANKTILITRPHGREKHLRHLIEQAGGSVIHYPAFNIQPPAELEIEHLLHLRDQLHRFTMAIFISQTAVEQSQIYFPVLPEHLTVVSIGSKTSQALEQQNIHVDIEAEEYNTESLLQAPEFQMPQLQGQRVLIFRGTGGRALLGDTLVRRGAQIRYVETYRRELPPLPPLTEQQIEKLDALTVSSNEGLDNLIILIEDPSLLIDVPLVLPSQRAAKLARQHGFKTIISAQNATDEATLKALIDHFSSSTR